MRKNKRDLVDVLSVADADLAAITGGTKSPVGPALPVAKSTLPGGGAGDPTAWSAEYGDELEDAVAVDAVDAAAELA